MDTGVTEILKRSMNSVEEVTVYEVVTEYRPSPDVNRLLQHYPTYLSNYAMVRLLMQRVARESLILT